MGRSDAQGVGEAGASLSAMVEHNNDGTSSPEMKQWRRENRATENEKRRRLQSFKGWPGSSRKLHCGLHRASATPKRPRPRLERRRKKRRQCSKSGEHCSSILQNCHSPKFTIYSQNFITTQKSPKTKVVQNQKFYNFAFETISKFILHFEIQI